MIKKITMENNAKRELALKALDRQNSKWQRLKDFVRCKDKNKKAQVVAGIRSTLSALNNPA